MLSHEKELNKARARSLMLVTLMLGSIFISFIPAVSASHVETYHTQRNPVTIDSGDLDCDGDPDIVAGSEMGMFITVLYNDDGDFSDRSDIWVSNNASRDASWVDMADASEVAIGDINDDGANDIVYFQQNVWVAGASAPPMGNVTVIWGDCSSDASEWSQSSPITVSPFMVGMEVRDINDDQKDDIVTLAIDETQTNMELMVMRGPNPTQQTSQATTNIPLSTSYYYSMALGHWGESVASFPAQDCEDVDIWMMSSPPYNGPQTGFSAGNFDNVTVLEYNCITNQYENPTTGTGGTHVFALNSNYDGQLDVADTDGDNVVDMVAMVEGWEQNITYATRTSVGGTWNTGNKANIGEYVGADVSITDINQDGHMDFLVPTMLTVSSVNSAGSGQQKSLTTDNLRDINTVNIILNDGTGNYLNAQSFDVGRRPTMAIADQFTGGANSALDLAVGQRDYAFSYSNGAMWIDSKGWAGALDTLSIVELDSEDVGIGGVVVSPASWDPVDRETKIGEGTRNVNVTVRNTGLQTISGSVDVDVTVSEVTGGTDTVVYANDFDTAPSGTCSGCTISKASYTNEVSESYWHIEDGSNNSGNGNAEEVDTNPTNFMWVGSQFQNTSGDGDMETGYRAWWDEAVIIEGVDLSGADSASMDIDMYCMVEFSMIYYSSTGIANRIIYDDSCSVDVYSDDSGWTTLSYDGGYDIDRYIHLANGYDPEFTVSNTAYCCGQYNWYAAKGDNGYDLTPWAGDTVDIRFRFRTGHMGSVGNENATHNTELDGFAFDNITINKTVTQFGSNVQNVNQQLSLNGLAPGDEQVVTLQANFVNGTTYMIESELTSTNGFTNGDDTNDDSRWRTTVKNLFDPAVEGITSFEKGELLASGNYPIDVEVVHAGNTEVDFDVVASVYSAEPNTLLAENFEGGASGYSFGDDGDNFGIVVNDLDSTINNAIVPGNRPVFGSSAYWFGHPDDGYGDDWDETMTLQNIDLVGNTADFVYLNFDYFAETDYLTDSEGDIVGVLEYGLLEVEWRRGSQVYNGTIIGNWNDYNENGLQYNDTCEDIDDDGIYDETEYIGDKDWNVFFDSEGLVKGVTLDLTHIFLRNTTSPDSRDWDYNCTDLTGSEVTITYRFQSNDDGVNGNAGLAGFAIDNITVQEYVFTYVTDYTTAVSGLDSQETREINVGNHDFEQGIYRIDAITHFDNTTMGTAWYNHKEVNLANNVSRLIFEVASVDISLLRPDVLDCVEDAVGCVYPIDQVEQHAFSIPLINGVLQGEYDIKLKVTDMSTGSVVYDQASDESPLDLAPHDHSAASWASVVPSSGWVDGHMYNVTFYAQLTDGSSSGNVRYYHIGMADSVDIAILSNPTDQSRLDRVKDDLDAMGMTYTQFRVDDWDRYVTPIWMNHYDKILLPWQTENNVVNGFYYDQLSTTRASDGLSPMDVITARMQAGATIEMHLGPYRSAYQGGKLPYDMDVLNRNTAGNEITHDETLVMDWYHPMLASVNPVAFISFNGGHHVAESALDTSQVQNTQIPQVCGGRISDPLGTFHTLIVDSNDNTQALLATCNRGQGGMIITTIDVENPSVSDAYGTTGKPLLSNLLGYQVTPYPNDFGTASDGWDLTINGEALTYDTLTQSYGTHYMKSDADLDFAFTSTVANGVVLDADWELMSSDSNAVTNWDGNPLQAGDMDHRAEDSHTAGFCVLDAQSTSGCRQDAAWTVRLFLHDEGGHTRSASVNLVTNDALADEFNPIPLASIMDRVEYRGQVEDHGTYTTGGTDWPVNLIRLGPTGDVTLHFDASNSSDADAAPGSSTNGIERYIWKVFFDNPWDDPSGSLSGATYEVVASVQQTWTYRFQNITVDPSGAVENKIRIELTVVDKAGKPSLSSDKFRMYFVVVGDDYGDDEPIIDFTSPANGSSQTGDYVFVNGSVTSGSENGNVQIEIALVESILDADSGDKFADKFNEFTNPDGTYNSVSGLDNEETFSLQVSIADLHSTEGGYETIYIKITEGDGSRWIIYKSIDIALPPSGPDVPDEVDCEADPEHEDCQSTSSGSSDSGGAMLILGLAAGAVVLIIVVIVSIMVMRGRSDPTGTVGTTDGFQDASTLDPVEAYVQQLVAQGYPEDTARAYAQQYYAQAAQQQQPGGGGYA
ncbi:MAG: VCBS repeat-containing protein [Candidatus Thalassarchaeaceae archaeon]|nr:VCBS repeat-containing protein [Candidatus Thalassarchaeaceae archaeon]